MRENALTAESGYEPGMLARNGFLSLLGAAALAPEAADAQSATLDHAVIFRFPLERVPAAIAAFRELQAATRRQPGNLQYTVYRSTDDPLTFVIFERWASRAAIDAHEKTAVFLRLGRGTLERYATAHDAVSCRPLGD